MDCFKSSRAIPSTLECGIAQMDAIYLSTRQYLYSFSLKEVFFIWGWSGAIRSGLHFQAIGIIKNTLFNFQTIHKKLKSFPALQVRFTNENC